MTNKHEIIICMGSSCFSRGNNKNLQVIEKFIQENEIDAQVKIVGNRCQGNCSKGPNITIDDKTYSSLDEGATLDLLKALD